MEQINLVSPHKMVTDVCATILMHFLSMEVAAYLEALPRFAIDHVRNKKSILDGVILLSILIPRMSLM